MEIRVDQDTSFVLWAFALTGSVGLLPCVACTCISRSFSRNSHAYQSLFAFAYESFFSMRTRASCIGVSELHVMLEKRVTLNKIQVSCSSVFALTGSVGLFSALLVQAILGF